MSERKLAKKQFSSFFLHDFQTCYDYSLKLVFLIQPINIIFIDNFEKKFNRLIKTLLSKIT